MIESILRFSLSHRALVLLGAALLIVWGGVTAARAPVDVFPDLTAPTVTVITEAHGMAPEELETRVTYLIETALNGAPGIRRVRSTTGIGLALVYAEFEWGEDVYRARQVVAERLQLVQGALPAEVEAPVLAPVSSIMGEILFLAMSSERHTPMEVRTAADFTVRRRLLAVPGVSQVIVTGGERRTYQVALDPGRLDAYGVSVDEVLDALAETDRSVSAGFVVEGGQEYLVHGSGRARTPEDVAETLVTIRDGEPVLVRHLGAVAAGAALRRGAGSYQGAPAVILGVQKQPGANTLELTRRLDAEIEAIAATLPPGLEIHRDVVRQADFIEVAIDNVAAALRDGVLLVLLIVTVFLASARASAITATAIPLSLVAAVFVLDRWGATLNTMTLGGMAIAVGELVDDAVVDVENVVRRLRQNAALPAAERQDALAVVFAASKEIRGSIVFATLIIGLAFAPLFFLSGVEGRLLQPLGVAYVVSLAASLVVALTVTPALCSWLLPGSRAVAARHEPRLVAWLRRGYAPVLGWALGRWRLLAALSLAGLLAAGVALGSAGRAFLPEFREGTLTVAAVTLPGTSLAESDALGRRLEEALLRQPEVASVARRTGRAELDEHAQGVHAAELDVRLGAGGRPREAVLASIREEASRIPGLLVTLGQPISHRIDHMLSGSRASVAVKIFGDDLAELRRLGREVEEAMEGIAGVVDRVREPQVDVPFARVRFDRAALARYGLRVGDVARHLEVATGQRVVAQVLVGQVMIDLVVRFAGGSIEDVDGLGETRILTPSGARVPLRAVAEVRRDRGPNEIGREGVQRRTVVTCNVAGRDVGAVVADIKAAIEAKVPLPAGYRVVYGGHFERATAAARTILMIGAGCVVGVFALLATAFRSARDAALVMLNLPLALIGGVVGVLLEGGVLSVASLVGFITLFGIATRNGIMLVTHVHHLMRVEGVRDVAAAVRQAASERLAPILMTALAAGLALVPLALAGGEAGSEIQAPMAVVILCGLVSSTALNMLVVPALYVRFGSLRAGAGRAEGA